LSDFKANKITALVATEVAARGLDIKELPYVVNYELPNVPEDYVHRIGRTARAGGTGCAVSLVSPDEAPLLRDIERLLKRSLSVAALPSYPVSAPPQQLPQSDRLGPPSGHGRERAHGQHSHGPSPRRDGNSAAGRSDHRSGGDRPSSGNRRRERSAAQRRGVTRFSTMR
jgi:ATP-dependent RNA helicase RhlE